MAHGGNWLKQLPLVLLGLRMHPDEDGSCAISRVTGEQPLIPAVLSKWADQKQISKAMQELTFPYRLTRGRAVKDQQHSTLSKADHVWLRLDRVRRSLEAPYQGPFKVLKRHDTTFTIEVKGRPMVVSIERVKPATIPPNTKTENTCPSGHTEKTPSGEGTRDSGEEKNGGNVTRGGRKIQFRPKDSFVYF